MGKGSQVTLTVTPEEELQGLKKGKDAFYLSPTDERSCKEEGAWQQGCRTRLLPYAVFILGAISSACASTSEAITKFAPSLGPSSNLIFRNIYITNFCLPLLILQKGKKNNQTLQSSIFGSWKLILARSVMSCTAFYLYYNALRRMPLAEASLIQSTWTALVTIFARIFLKEKIDCRKVISVALTLCGVCALSRLPLLFFVSSMESKYSSTDYWLGFSGALLSTVAASAEALLLRKLRHVGDLPLLLSQGFSTIAIFLGVGLVEGSLVVPHCGLEAVLMVFHGLFGTIVLPLRTLCFKLEDASVVAVALTSFRILFNFMFQAFFFKDAIDAYSIAGTILIFASLLCCAAKNRKTSK